MPSGLAAIGKNNKRRNSQRENENAVIKSTKGNLKGKAGFPNQSMASAPKKHPSQRSVVASLTSSVAQYTPW